MTQTINSLHKQRIVALLQAQGKEMEVSELRLALALVVNDLARRAILGKPIRKSAVERLRAPKNQLPAFDEFVGQLVEEGAVQVTVRMDREWVSPGPDAWCIKVLPEAEQRRVVESLRALAKILECVKKVA